MQGLFGTNRGGPARCEWTGLGATFSTAGGYCTTRGRSGASCTCTGLTTPNTCCGVKAGRHSGGSYTRFAKGERYKATC